MGGKGSGRRPGHNGHWKNPNTVHKKSKEGIDRKIKYQKIEKSKKKK